MHRVSDNSRKEYGCHLSGARHLLGSNCSNLSFIILGVVLTFDNVSPLSWLHTAGMLSAVKTLLKNIFRASALYFDDVAIVPSGLFNVGIVLLVLCLDLVDFQKTLGLLFILLERFCSNVFLKCLVEERSLVSEFL